MQGMRKAKILNLTVGETEHFFQLEKKLVVSTDNEICEACHEGHRKCERGK